MIGQIKGQVIEKTTHQVLLDVGGLGYEVEVPISTAFALPDPGTHVTLHTHFVVREDAQLLYGFSSRTDRDMFRTLIRVNGVGPKLGIAILSGLDGPALARCVRDDDVSTLVKLPGIGKKTAERLLIELRDKVKTIEEGGNAGQADLVSIPSSNDVAAEAESALVALGYKPQEASKAIKKVAGPDESVESLVKAALKNML